MSDNPNKDFYVGYLALPKRLRAVLIGLVALLFAIVAFDAWLFATWQPAAGDGRWAETPTEYVGTLVRDPYPMLRVMENGKLRTYVVISEEKRGAEEALTGINDGATIKLNGYLIERAAMSMIQLAATDIRVENAPVVPEPAREIHGQITLEGEIVDSKCWLGVMRPGEGQVHKACASLCIRGGIPPMFVTRMAGRPPITLMTTLDGGKIPVDAILDHVADPVRLSGLLEKRGDITVFKVDLSTLARTK